jgi:hypothetical protein
MNFKVKSPWDFVFALSIVGILVGGWFAFFASKPKIVQAKSSAEQLSSARKEADYLTQRANEEETGQASKTWSVSQDALGSEVLAAINKVAKDGGLLVADFRSGRQVRAASLTEANFSVVLEGPFTSVMAAVKKLEASESKLALSQLKLSSKSKGDEVTAAIGLTGFLINGGTARG